MSTQAEEHYAKEARIAARVCDVDGCGKRHLAQGLCSAHYYRQKRNGSPLAGGISKGEAQRYFREVVMAYEGDECLTWPYDVGSTGYGRVHFGGKQKNVSRLVCEEVHGPAPSADHQAAHSCGKGHLGCVAKRHLSWKTPVENAADKIGHGTVSVGERNGAAKLTWHEVSAIRALQGQAPQRVLAARFGVTQTLVSQIHMGKIWR